MQTEIITQLSEFVYNLANTDPKPSLAEVELAILRWAVDNDIIIFQSPAAKG